MVRLGMVWLGRVRYGTNWVVGVNMFGWSGIDLSEVGLHQACSHQSSSRGCS